MSLAIRAHDLGKRYRIGVRQERYSTLRDMLGRSLAAPFRWLARATKPASTNRSGAESIWALQNVSVEIQRGEVVGVIGRNGAGKSTLLKILSRITEPTEGYADIYGRVGSLLEVGTGFHPELTGRENIYLNGAILGMKKAEIDRKFDEIVSFAEVDRFIDTPVKHYSSGMYVRLAFGVAAHLDPEILLVDEVLAVGDAQFQRKCLGKMSEVARGGRTILFVSHNMGAVQRLCNRVILLQAGRVEDIFSDAVAGVRAYLSAAEQPQPAWKRNQAVDGEAAHFLEAHVGSANGYLNSRDHIPIHVVWKVPTRSPDLYLGIGVYTEDGMPLFGTQPEDAGIPTPTEPGMYRAQVVVPGEVLVPGSYRLSLALWSQSRGAVDLQEHAVRFEVREAPCLFNSVLPSRAGYVQIRCAWQVDSGS